MRHLTVLKYIEKISRTGSLRSAAEELGITASALNRRILGIEEEDLSQTSAAPLTTHLNSIRLNQALILVHIRSCFIKAFANRISLRMMAVSPAIAGPCFVNLRYSANSTS